MLTSQEVKTAIRERRCNGCGLPQDRWGPVCGGVTIGDFTHYHSPEWWVARAAKGMAETPAPTWESPPRATRVVTGGSKP